MELKMYEFESGVTDWICAESKEEAIEIYKSYYGEDAYTESLEMHGGNIEDFITECDGEEMFIYYENGINGDKNTFNNLIKKYCEKPDHFATSEY